MWGEDLEGGMGGEWKWEKEKGEGGWMRGDGWLKNAGEETGML